MRGPPHPALPAGQGEPGGPDAWVAAAVAVLGFPLFQTPFRPALAAGLLAALLGCAGAPGGAAHPPEEHGVLALVVRGDTTVVDEYRRSATALRGVVRPRVPGAEFGWARYRVDFAPSGEAVAAHLAEGRVGTPADGPAVDSLTTTLGAGGIREEWPNRPPTVAPPAPGAVPLFGPSLAMFQEVLIRARRLTGGRGEVELPLYSLLNRGEVERVRVRWSAPDTAEVRWGEGPASRFAVDARGRILGGRSADGEFVTVRLR